MSLKEAFRSLVGLSLGDAFGQALFFPGANLFVERRELPPAPWHWSDDTQIAISVVEELEQRGWIDQDHLARRMAWRYSTDPLRGYGTGTRQTLERIAQGEYFRSVTRAAFDGGSYGAAAASRCAPIGAFFTGDPARAASEARLATAITHSHTEALAAGEAVAAVACLAAGSSLTGADWLRAAATHVTESGLRQAVLRAAGIPPGDLTAAIEILGTGESNTVIDTVPFALWCAAYHRGQVEEALWVAVCALGNRDATCAITASILALTVPQLPQPWTVRCEPLPRGSELDRELKQQFALFSSPTSDLFRCGQPDSSSHPDPFSTHVDALTGLPNLLALLSCMENLAASPGEFSPFRLVILHLVGLWDVNRSQGRTAGDEFLRSTAKMLQHQVPGPIFRAGGDKFVIIETGLPNGSLGHNGHTRADAINIQGLKPARMAVIQFTRADLCTPGQVLACISSALADQHYLNSTSPQEFSAAEIRAASNFPWPVMDLADQILQIGQMADESSRLAHTDSISQLPNMRAALSALDTSINRARARRELLAVLLVDGDNLRLFNQISYEAGDEAIRLLGSTLRGQLRDSDFLARWRTGDEFLILLPDTDRDTAVEIAQRLCKGVQRASRSWVFPCTISIGIAIYPNQGPAVQELLHQAEQGLDAAKHAGKNRVVVGFPRPNQPPG